MAIGYLPAPGTEYGPCELGPNGEYLCDHTDCYQMYGDYNMKCRYCGERIGWDQGYFNVTGDDHIRTMVHARCSMEAIEAEREDQKRGA